MSGETALGRLRRLALDWRLVDREVGSDRLIAAALEAVLDGVESPALIELAGLTRAEEPEAAELFERVVDELGLAPVLPELPGEHRARHSALVRWWAGFVVAGEIAPGVGGCLIWQRGWPALGYPEALMPMVTAAALYDDRESSWAVWDTDRDRELAELGAQIVEAARGLLAFTAD